MEGSAPQPPATQNYSPRRTSFSPCLPARFCKSRIFFLKTGLYGGRFPTQSQLRRPSAPPILQFRRKLVFGKRNALFLPPGAAAASQRIPVTGVRLRTATSARLAILAPATNGLYTGVIGAIGYRSEYIHEASSSSRTTGAK